MHGSPLSVSTRRPGICRRAAFVLAMSVMGCGPASPPVVPDAEPGIALAEVGTGTVAFESVAEEQPLILWAGPQGGHHFIVHARMKGLDPGDPKMIGIPENPRTTFAAYTAEGEQVDLRLPAYAMGYEDELGDGWRYLISGRLLMVEEPLVPLLFGQRMLIRVTIVDVDGRTATDSVWVVATEEPDPVDASVPDAAGLIDAGAR